MLKLNNLIRLLITTVC